MKTSAPVKLVTTVFWRQMQQFMQEMMMALLTLVRLTCSMSCERSAVTSLPSDAVPTVMMTTKKETVIKR
jgi:hypothetical protein